MEPAAGPGKLRRWHQDQGILHFLRVQLVVLELLQQVRYPYDVETLLFKSVNRFIVAIVSQNNTLFQGKQVARVCPLFACVEWERVVAGVNEFGFLLTPEVVCTDIAEQILD